MMLFCASAYACPDGCTCESKLKTVSCPNADYENLREIVANLSSDTAGLVIGGPGGNATVPSLRIDTFKGIAAEGLTDLTLYSTGLLTIDDHALLPLKFLKTLTLKSNPLAKISSSLIADSPALTMLTITMCPNLEAMSPISGGNNLNYLDLSNNSIRTIPDDAFSTFTKLTSLNLAYNKFDEISAGIFKGLKGTLKELDLSQSTPPKSILDRPFEFLISLTTLKFVGIGSNAFKATIFSGLAGLRNLDISNNGLTDFPFETMGFFAEGLTELTFDNNNVPILKASEFEQLPKLQRLSLQRTGLKELRPEPFHANPALEDISLTGNNLSSIPTNVFAHLPNLVSLDLSGCGLDRLENDTFAGSNKLATLNLAGSILPHIESGPFDPLGNLLQLDLSYSSIRSIAPGAFDALKNLTLLNLDMNLLETVSDDLLKMFKDDEVHVYMPHNLWDCSCEGMERTKDFFDKSNYTTSMICNKPDELKGHDVADVAKGQMCYAPNITNCCHVDIKAELGEKITFFCNVTGSPAPDIKYDVISGDPLPANRTSFSDDKTMVTVYDVSNTNNGNFTCFAENRYGNITNYFEMYIFTPEPTVEPSKPYKKGSLTWIILGVAIAVVFLVTLIGLIVYFVRRRHSGVNELLVNSMENNAEA
jgi:Leucine-rich repeat (LRR) protein